MRPFIDANTETVDQFAPKPASHQKHRKTGKLDPEPGCTEQEAIGALPLDPCEAKQDHGDHIGHTVHRSTRFARVLSGIANQSSQPNDIAMTPKTRPMPIIKWATPNAVENAAAVLESTFGPTDVWINNAMASVFSPIHAMHAEEFKRVSEVTYLGVVHGTWRP